MSKLALKVVESQPLYRREIELWSDGSEKDSHSLHYALSYPEAFRPEIPAYFINNFSKKGDVVLDPFCGGGTTALEAALKGRIPYASDLNGLAVRITDAKLHPADITDVTLFLQRVNLRRPVALKAFNEIFSAFYDLDTFREIANLRAYLHEHAHEEVARFVELVALALLHGHTASFLSVYSFPQISLHPDEQQQLNFKRRQTPDYRAVVPRVIRKTAALLRDGCPSVLDAMGPKAKIARTDSRDLNYVREGEVDLVVTAPPIPTSKDHSSELWLRSWFASTKFTSTGFTGSDGASSPTQSLTSWLDFMNESLVEMARVVKRGGRAVFDLREIRLEDGSSVGLDDELMSMVNRELGRYWEGEGVILNRQRYAKIKDCLKERDTSRSSRHNRLLVLRRR